jgi:16S rRNA G966 N2-methylase RsmD
VFVEKHKGAAALIRENLESLGLLGRATVVAAPALKELAKHRADIVFLDPPYPLEKEYAPALELVGRMGAKLAIAQHSVRFDPGEQAGALVRYRMVRQGDNALSWYRRGILQGGLQPYS